MVDLVQPNTKTRVLILGDSISIGYTPFLKQILENEAVVVRPMKNEKAAENCAGTDYGIKNIDRWLQLDGGAWDVIHFNFGLHDLKHVDATTGKNSKNANDPYQSNPEEYEKQLHEIVDKLQKTGAKLIFCTTTPVPNGCQPLRETTTPEIYNAVGKKIAKDHGIVINDLYAFALPQLSEIQRPADVHFSKKGSEILASQVAKSIREVTSVSSN
jgi:acyl-CoA thioesterase-1